MTAVGCLAFTHSITVRLTYVYMCTCVLNHDTGRTAQAALRCIGIARHSCTRHQAVSGVCILADMTYLATLVCLHRKMYVLA